VWVVNVPDGFVGRTLDRRQMEVYLCMVRETMNVAEILAAQLRAIEIIAAHDAVGELHGFSR
jgi:hypothetical protein